MTFSIYDLILLISSDCFSKNICITQENNHAERIQQIARNIVPILMNDGDNYFEDVNFSPEKIKEFEGLFISKINESHIKEEEKKRVNFLVDIIKNSNNHEYESTAQNTLVSICSHIYWLNTSNLSQTIDNKMLSIIEKIEPIGPGIKQDSTPDWLAIKDMWNKSHSSWDNYIKKITSDVPDSPCTTFDYLINHTKQLDFIYEWKEVLTTEEFIFLKNFLAVEGTFELEKISPLSHQEYQNIINSI
ncbi:hypothetical protein LQR31_22760 [Chromobacterium vaccinii]|uniref:hypothetical protein n=1 Tax=Chromobacterium vaccinii TaxID=1108595 RepID=UPI001E33E924|nr:hypothetical protein [Chromobacterium vaccinii]MCD4487296.1 hypothetical protein [Chromobacterium vaccinii]